MLFRIHCVFLFGILLVGLLIACSKESDKTSPSTNPTVVVSTQTLVTFTTASGTPSAAQSYVVSGSNLTGAITVGPLAGYEFSTTGGAPYSASLSLTPISGTVANTTVSVRLTGAAGSFSGSVTNVSTGAATVNVTVNGVVMQPGAIPAALWLTTSSRSNLFRKQTTRLYFNTSTVTPTITVDTTRTYQTMDGFGFALTDGSASLIHQMSTSSRAALLQELFATDSTWIGVSYLRVSIGASDLSPQVYTYDDLSGGGTTDPTLSHFSLAAAQTDLIPVLQQILAINPTIKILGSPWTAPSWMKDNNSPQGGSLLPQYYSAYAQYFVKYIQGMQAAGIHIDAVTLQNEPLNPYNNPSMLMTAPQQIDFIANYVGPAFQANSLTTKIIAYDHNPDMISYPETVLSDPTANPYVDGSAFHLYGGTIDQLSGIHSMFPAKNIYFTEQYTDSGISFADNLGPAMQHLIIGAPNNWSRNVLQWNLAADPSNNPHTVGGCSTCLPAITISGSSVTRNVAYYTTAHASKFVRPGSVRIGSNALSNLPNVAYQRPDGKKVLIVLNSTSSPITFNIGFRGKILPTTLTNGSVGTYIW